MDEPPLLLEIYCATCGCPREPHVHPCPDCGDMPYSLVPNVLFLFGWLKRKGELF